MNSFYYICNHLLLRTKNAICLINHRRKTRRQLINLLLFTEIFLIHRQNSAKIFLIHRQQTSKSF